MEDADFAWYVGIDWASETHQVCLLNGQGKRIAERVIAHSGEGIASLLEWLVTQSEGQPATVAVAIETPRGALVESLVERGVAVFAVNPKQVDRFRDRHSVAGAKDDRLDAYVLADSVRTDRRHFRRVRLEAPEIIRLRELSRLEEELGQECRRLTNQVREQLQRYFPAVLAVSPAADEPWLWALLEFAPLPAQARTWNAGRLDKLLKRHRIRRIDGAALRAVLQAPPLSMAPGAGEAASEHVALLLPRLRLVAEQRAAVKKRIGELLDSLAAADDSAPGQSSEHRDAALLLSLPGVGRVVAATRLAEAGQALADRDYHGLRSYAGVAPITRQSGKSRKVSMRYACQHRLRNALYHWARVSTYCEERSKQQYAALRARGHTHGRALRSLADRWLAVLIAMLKTNTLYDAGRRAGAAAEKAVAPVSQDGALPVS